MFQTFRIDLLVSFVKYLKEIPGLVHEFKECLSHAAHSNTLVEAYIGPNIDVNSHQYRDIADRFKQYVINVEGGKIYQESIRPLRLVFKKQEEETEEKTAQK